MEDTESLTQEEKTRAAKRAWYHRNKEKVSAQRAEVNAQDPELAKQKRNEYYENNKPKLMKMQRARRVEARRARNDAIGAFGY